MSLTRPAGPTGSHSSTRAGNAQAVGQFIVDVALGAQATDATVLQNKVAVVGYFTTALANGLSNRKVRDLYSVTTMWRTPPLSSFCNDCA